MDQFLRLGRVMPVVTIEDAAVAAPLAAALLEGGIRTVEVTLRTPCALEAIARIARETPDCVVGAGTVLSIEDYEASMAAGASFAICPGATEALLVHGSFAQIPFLPAVATASEIMRGLHFGYRHFKFFPAESLGGPAALKALHGPFPEVRFCPTGGILESKVSAYLSLPNVLCVGGSWVVPAADLKLRNFAAITQAAKRAAAFHVAKT